jgi:hypothetical protein
VQGIWPCKPWADSDGDSRRSPRPRAIAKTADPLVNKLAPSLVLVNFDMPYSVSGITERSYYGTGVIVDAERGLVVVDRNTVPTPLGDVRLTFSGRSRFRAASSTCIRCTTSRSSRTTRSSSARRRRAPRRCATELQPGEAVWAVGVRPDGKVQSRSANGRSIDPVAIRCRARCSSATPTWRRSR